MQNSAISYLDDDAEKSLVIVNYVMDKTKTIYLMFLSAIIPISIFDLGCRFKVNCPGRLNDRKSEAYAPLFVSRYQLPFTLIPT